MVCAQPIGEGGLVSGYGRLPRRECRPLIGLAATFFP